MEYEVVFEVTEISKIHYYTAAGSTVTGDVGAGELAIARARQVNKAGWVEKFREKNKK